MTAPAVETVRTVYIAAGTAHLPAGGSTACYEPLTVAGAWVPVGEAWRWNAISCPVCFPHQALDGAA